MKHSAYKINISSHHILMGSAALILAFEPMFWLMQTWRDPSYDSKGFIVFFVCAAMFTWSITSVKTTHRPNDKKIPLILLALSACVRLMGQITAINVIGALTLIVDVYAISRISNLHHRKHAVSPFWLAACFAFSLPLERIIQRTMGYGLQHISANGACSVLSTVFENVTCHGVRILINTQDVMVDLPCSGARSVLLLLFFYCVCAAVSRFNIREAILGAGITLVSALIMNIIRICILAIGLAYPLEPIDVMAQPAHDIIGLLTLAMGCAPIVLWAQKFYRPQKFIHPVLDQARWIIPRSIRRDGWWLEKSNVSKPIRVQTCIAMACVIAAVVITNLPRKAMDVARADLPLSLPHSLNNTLAKPVSLTSAEQVYFTQYGGSAKKAIYGQFSLMMVRTSAPLRHLHAPDECLRGLGMDVEYKGTAYDTIPTAIYKATDQDGNEFRIAVSFIPSDYSAITTNVSEAVWRWMQNNNQIWTAVQRISPWDADEHEAKAFDDAVTASLDLELQNLPFQIATSGE